MEVQEHVSVEELRRSLTSKNEEYIHKLERALAELGVASDVVEKNLNEMLPVIVQQQKTGMTARQLYGTVTQCAADIAAGPKVDSNAPSPWWQIWLDGSLLLGGMFSLISAMVTMFGSQQSAGMGVITLALNFVLGGAILMMSAKFAPDMNKPKGQRGYWKYLAVSIGLTLVWIVAVMGSQMVIPEAINVALPEAVYLVLGAGMLLLKWYLKKTLNIRGTLM